jgi:hypothetical protein
MFYSDGQNNIVSNNATQYNTIQKDHNGNLMIHGCYSNIDSMIHAGFTFQKQKKQQPFSKRKMYA